MCTFSISTHTWASFGMPFSFYFLSLHTQVCRPRSNGRIPVPVFSQVFRPSSNGRHILPLPPMKAVLFKPGIMTITLNVLITLTSAGKIFSVWSEPIACLARIEQTIGAGLTITDAIDDWFDKLPPYFFIDDETTLYKERLMYKIKRPFMVEKGENPRIFRAC